MGRCPMVNNFCTRLPNFWSLLAGTFDSEALVKELIDGLRMASGFHQGLRLRGIDQGQGHHRLLCLPEADVKQV